MRTQAIPENERRLSKEAVLELTNNGLDFFKFVIPDLKPGKTKCNNVKNPFYEDKNASFSIYLSNEKWRYKDFGEPAFKGDVFNFAALHYKLDVRKDFYEILKRMNEDLELKLVTSFDFPSAPSFTYKESGEDGNIYKVYYKIGFSQEDLDYWKQFGISEQTLDAFKVKPVLMYELTQPDHRPFKFFSKTENLLFAYEISENCIKLYKPYDKEYKFRFIGKKPEDFCFGWELVNSYEPGGDPVIITGGEKDVMTLYELGFFAFCLNSETADIANSGHIEHPIPI